MARPERFELPTTWFVARYSIQLSYGRAGAAYYRGAPPARQAVGVKPEASSRRRHPNGYDIRVVVLLMVDRGRVVPQQPQ